MKKEFIKCCPFCGSFTVELARTHENCCWVQCSRCSAEAPFAKTRLGAILIWNSRVQHCVPISATIEYDGDKVFKADIRKMKISLKRPRNETRK